ncbi:MULTISPECIES: NAD kinase [Capnocytophaga]|jgi:probable inorganic polyphosphate/ATP-NAD kinase|uniref:NAD kinase n=1 Tax=Capnocytophaga leadbetteri TaxID=327575 RepID=A0A250F9Y7_9FLAO|nr:MULTISPECIES: NAD kinase [Capnocytophaga]ATA81940.1 NAD kinase [Capnocytophaga leadbetteri]KHE68105.1 NAD(+)/NADH kinase [Capnocytophaga sp. oral taxon 329 str. F0087]QGS16743.1 NAD kinase [Capnocytophaga sp. FDAARGOS_737]
MKIAIYIRQYTAENESILQQLFSLFTPDDQVYIEQEILSELQLRSDKFNSAKSFASFEDLNTSYDVMLTIGGDGTLLKGITYVRSLQIPILGINAGRLGFLATAHKDDLPNVLEQLRKGDYQVVERSVIEAVFADTGEPVDTVNFALNEITVTRKNTASMITVDTELNGDYLCSYWADGLIIATPTGSTGYSLSCAGPVILPTAKNFVLTPIAPHNLSARPVIIPEDAEVKLSISGREKKFLMSLDSHIKSIPNKQSIIVRKAPFVVKMIRLEGDSFIKTLRTKLLWGEDKRNK